MKHRLYDTYNNMKQRCYNPNRPDYKYYGGRGIKVSDDWLKGFKYFLADMEISYQEGLTLDRIDVNLDYCKENCRWIEFEEQARNKRIYITANADVSGVSMHNDRWRARAYWKNKSYSLGVYLTKQEAVNAVIRFKENLC